MVVCNVWPSGSFPLLATRETPGFPKHDVGQAKAENGPCTHVPWSRRSNSRCTPDLSCTVHAPGQGLGDAGNSAASTGVSHRATPDALLQSGHRAAPPASRRTRVQSWVSVVTWGVRRHLRRLLTGNAACRSSLMLRHNSGQLVSSASA